MTEAPPIGLEVRVIATGATGTVVERDLKYRTADVDLGDGIIAEMEWDEIEPLPGRN